MENSKIVAYKMSRTQNMPNLREAIGETIVIVDMAEREYTDTDGKAHHVMAIRTADGKYYRTEVSSFIESFRDYWEFFRDDEEKPEIIITGKTSKRGNEYVDFDIITA